MFYIKANGMRFAIDIFGDAKNKPVFLIHGLTYQRMTTARLAEALMDEYFVVTYDCRGHGQSSHPASYTLKDHAEDLLALIDVFGYEKASVVGVSMGSYIALQAAEMAPEKFEKVALVTAKSYDDGNGSSIQRLMKEAGLDLREASKEDMMKVINKALWSPTITPERMEEVAQKLVPEGENVVQLTPEETAAVNQALKGFDLRPGFSKATCRTLVLSGTYDGINPPPLGKEIANALPNAIYDEIQGGHAFEAEFPDDYHNRIREFLAE